jgi:hypothetical protein
MVLTFACDACDSALVEAAFLSLAMILIGVSRQDSEGNHLAHSSMDFLTLSSFVQSYY